MHVPGFILDTVSSEHSYPLDQNVLYDILILGGGPAAMSAAIYAARKMLNIAFVTVDFGGQIRETSEVENYLGFQSINAHDLIERFQQHVKSFRLPIGVGARVEAVFRNDGLFTAVMEDGLRYTAKTVIYATGARHRQLAVPGEKELIGRGVTYCSICDAPLYKDRKVMVVGGGNSAFTAALDLSRGNATIILVNNARGWQADAILQRQIRDYKKIEFLDLHEVVRIEGGDRVEGVTVRGRVTGEEKTVAVDGVFIEIGLLPNSDPVKNLVELNERGEVVVDCLCRTNIPGFFAAGDVTTIPHKQIIVAAGEGAKAALSAHDYLVQTSRL